MSTNDKPLTDRLRARAKAWRELHEIATHIGVFPLDACMIDSRLEDAAADEIDALQGRRSAAAATSVTDKLHKMLDEAEISRKHSMDAGATWQEYTLAERLEIVLGANRMMERELDEKVEVEARCCPEDVGFEEWVGVLEKRDNVVANHHLRELVSLLLQTRGHIGPMRDRGDYPVELQRAIDFLHGRSAPSGAPPP